MPYSDVPVMREEAAGAGAGADGETDLCSALCTIARLQSRVEHQEQRINDVAFRYEAMFGMDALFRIVFPERVSPHASACNPSGAWKNALECSEVSVRQGASIASGCGLITPKRKNA